jgi:hypothetical protein
MIQNVGGTVRLCEHSICFISTVYSLTGMIRGPRPLKDHVATVAAYLNHYKLGGPNLELGAIKFTSYLISTCWPKMVRRIESWQAMGFIYLLKTISIEQLEIFGWSWDGFQVEGPSHGDKTLEGFLLNLKPQLKRNLLLASDRDKNDIMLNYTEVDFPVMFKSQSSGLSFSKENIAEFHKLTLAAFEGFAFTFIRLKGESKKLVGGIDYY